MHKHCTRACAQHSSTLATPIDFMGSLMFEDHTKIRLKMASFSVEAMVRGHHVYQDIWTAVIGEEFPCKREAGNSFDPFAVAVTRGDTNTVIGHEGYHLFAPSFCDRKALSLAR